MTTRYVQAFMSSVFAILVYAQLLAPVYAQDMNAVLLPPQFLEKYSSEEEAIAKGENGSLEEKRKAAATFFLLGREVYDRQAESLDYMRKASRIINRIYRRNRNDLLLGLLAGTINLGLADASPRLKDKISYTNRGLANYEFVLPNMPDSLEAIQLYMRSAIFVPTFFKDLTQEQLFRGRKFLDRYESSLAKLQNPTDRKRLAELKTHIYILMAELSNRNRKTRGDVSKYLAQVDTSFFDHMRETADRDLVEMYEKLKK